MPEATFLCIDNSDWMRNGDYSPNRMMAVQEGCSLLCEALMQRNPENVIGFLTFGGKACSVRETLTEDIDRVSGSLASIAVGGESHFAYGVQIAMLALSHVKNTRSQKQIAVFVGSPINDSADRLKQLATALRKDDVGVSIISLGCPENTPILQQFTEQVQKNSHLYVVPENGSVIDFLFTTALMGGDSGAAGAGGAGGAGSGVGGGQPGGGYGGEADDSEFAMAIRASLEEEQRRQAAAANNNNSSAPAATEATTSAPAATTTANTTAPVHNDAAPEDDLELALRLSMEEALRAEQQQQEPSSSSQQQQTSTDAAPTAATTTTSNNNTTSSNTNNNNENDMAEFEAAIQDPEVLKMLEEAAKEDKKGGDGDDKDKK